MIEFGYTYRIESCVGFDVDVLI